ncbi:hypothetical protein JOQ06_001537, partial [Pogonophryne albipinna]
MCTPIIGHGFVLDKYKCQCRRGFYHPSRVVLNGFKSRLQIPPPPENSSSCSTPGSPLGSKNPVTFLAVHFPGSLCQHPYKGCRIESTWKFGKEQGSNRDDSSEVSSKCLPCREGCPYCRDETPCLAQEDGALRLAVASFQGLCTVLDLAGMVVIYHFRRMKSIRTSGLILLEAILFGALLLYFPVMILFFQPSVFRCILLRWVRLLGFSVMYGTVILKLYRVLKNPELSPALIAAGHTPEGLQFSMCLLDRWDYMMAV